MNKEVTLRWPRLDDGMAVNELVKNCPPLDPNSGYCNFLQCSHFAPTSVAAEQDGQLLGFISGYRLPHQPGTLFIWQVAVSPAARGMGLAGKMLRHIVGRSCNAGLTHMETTITPDNEASWSLFRRFAERMGTGYESEVWLDSERHFGGEHDSEELLRIGPFDAHRACD